MSNPVQACSNSLVVAIVGATATGKSELALRLSRCLSVEIVNADSRQVYRSMDIGTGKPSLSERAQVPHHVFDVVNPDDEFSLAEYLRHARAALDGISARGHLPLVVGGSGQYVWSLMEGWHVPEVPPDAAFRLQLEQVAREQGHEAVHQLLARIDPDAAHEIQPTNVRRVIRALELFHATGTPPTDLRRRRTPPSARTLILGLALDRPLLHSKIDARIATMVRAGFADEVRALLAAGYGASLPSMSSIGYREMIHFVTGAADLETAVAGIRRETRRLVRRQHAWFKSGDERIMWVDAQDLDAAVGVVSAAVQERMR